MLDIFTVFNELEALENEVIKSGKDPLVFGIVVGPPSIHSIKLSCTNICSGSRVSSVLVEDDIKRSKNPMEAIKAHARDLMAKVKH